MALPSATVSHPATATWHLATVAKGELDDGTARRARRPSARDAAENAHRHHGGRGRAASRGRSGDEVGTAVKRSRATSRPPRLRSFLASTRSADPGRGNRLQHCQSRHRAPEALDAVGPSLPKEQRRGRVLRNSRPLAVGRVEEAPTAGRQHAPNAAVGSERRLSVRTLPCDPGRRFLGAKGTPVPGSLRLGSFRTFQDLEWRTRRRSRSAGPLARRGGGKRWVPAR